MNYLLEGEQTKRLSFRKVKSTDFYTWLPFHEEPLSHQYWAGLPREPKAACEEQFANIFRRYDKGLGGMNALILKSENRLVGLCGLLVQEVDGQSELEIGYSILPEKWGMGIATEAARKCKEVAFKNQWAKSLISIIHIDNLPSQKVALKNGMRLDKTTTYKDNPVQIFRCYV